MDEKKPRINLKIWKRMIPYVMRQKKYFVIVTIGLMISALLESVYPMFTSFAVNHFVIPATIKGILPFTLAFMAVIAVGAIAVIIYCRDAMVMEMRTGQALKHDCFEHLQELSLPFYNTNSVGYLLSRVMSDTDRISGIITWGVINSAWHIMYIIGAFILMFRLNVGLALLLLCVIPAVAAIIILFQSRAMSVDREIRHINSSITGAFNEGITGAKTSKTLVIEDRNCREFRDVTSLMYRRSVHRSVLRGIMIPLVFFCGSAAVSAVLYRGGHKVIVGSIDYGTLSAFITYAVAIIEPVAAIASMVNDLITAQVCLERVMAMLDEPYIVKDTPEVLEKYGTIFEPKYENWEKIKGDIDFDHVWFKYPDGGEYVLEDFSLHVPAGTTVAIVGETGAGKSTLVNLVCRFFEPTKGRVLIDGVDYRERSQQWLHSSLGYVLQDPHLFSGTIEENIRYGKLDATHDEVVQAAKLVCADTVADNMPQGYDAQVGEGGDRLSTGEKQLVSFARAVIARPPIFVLDEATSSIDTKTEMLIQNAISNILSGRTSFIIAHRLSTIRMADMIIVVDGGKIVELGTHDYLMEAQGEYAKLYEAMRIKEDTDKV